MTWAYLPMVLVYTSIAFTARNQLLTIGRIQHGQYYLSGLLPLCGIALPARLQKDRSGPLDSHADFVMVYSSHVAGSAIGETVVLGYSCLARYLGGIQLPILCTILCG